MEMEISVMHGGREVKRITRPIRMDRVHGETVTYRRQIWRVKDRSIELQGGPISEASSFSEPDETMPPISFEDV